MSIGPSYRDMDNMEVDGWYNRPTFPKSTGCKNWQEFCEFCRTNIGKPFLIVLSNVIGSHDNEMLVKNLFFGIMDVSGDGEDFKICVGGMTARFYVEDKGEDFHFFEDGVGIETLKIARSLRPYKIHEIIFDPEKIDDLLSPEMCWDSQFKVCNLDEYLIYPYSYIYNRVMSCFVNVATGYEFPKIRSRMENLKLLLSKGLIEAKKDADDKLVKAQKRSSSFQEVYKLLGV